MCPIKRKHRQTPYRSGRASRPAAHEQPQRQSPHRAAHTSANRRRTIKHPCIPRRKQSPQHRQLPRIAYSSSHNSPHTVRQQFTLPRKRPRSYKTRRASSHRITIGSLRSTLAYPQIAAQSSACSFCAAGDRSHAERVAQTAAALAASPHHILICPQIGAVSVSRSSFLQAATLMLKRAGQATAVVPPASTHHILICS